MVHRSVSSLWFMHLAVMQMTGCWTCWFVMTSVVGEVGLMVARQACHITVLWRYMWWQCVQLLIALASWHCGQCYNHPIPFPWYTSLPFHYACISLCFSFAYFYSTPLFPHVPLISDSLWLCFPWTFLSWTITLGPCSLPYLFKIVVTACISLTWIYLVLSDTWTLAPWEGG
jgi:hypothetical protein